MDKTLWEEYEKADLKVTAGQRGRREREPGYHSYATTFRKLPPLFTLSRNEQEMKYWNLTKSQQERSGPNKDEWNDERAQKLQGNI